MGAAMSVETRIREIGKQVRRTKSGNGRLDLVIRIPGPEASYHGEVEALDSDGRIVASLILSDFDHLLGVIEMVVAQAQEQLLTA